MKKYSYASVICLLAVVLAGSLGYAQGYEKYLGPADVEKAAGMKGVKAIAKDSQSGAGGDLNFTNADGEIILMVQFTDATNYEKFKKRYGKEAVAGVGDQAVQGTTMPGFPPGFLVFSKAGQCVAITAFPDFAAKKNHLTIDQLVALGKVLASRM